MTDYNVLLATPAANMRAFLFKTFENEAFEITCAADGQTALGLVRHNSIDLILADLDLPGVNGIELLHRAKSYDPDAIVVLIARQASITSAVAALRHGAFDYLREPINKRDVRAVVEAGLNARQRARQRRQLEQFAVQMLNRIDNAENALSKDDHVQTYGDLTINRGAFEACLYSQSLNLTLTEFRLLGALCSKPGVAQSYVKLVEAACGYTSTRQEAREIIGTHIRNLRHKLNAQPGGDYYITSVRGVGYLIRLPQAQAEVCCN